MLVGETRQVVEEAIGGLPEMYRDVYVLADGNYAPIAGNLKDWPAVARGADGWVEFLAPSLRPNAKHRPLVRALVTTLPDGSHVYVWNGGDDGYDASSFGPVADNIIVGDE